MKRVPRREGRTTVAAATAAAAFTITGGIGPGVAPAHAVTCDGTEILCLDLSSAAEVNGSGGQIVGGTFTGGGFKPTQGGGLDWDFGPDVDLSKGRLVFDVTGLLPTTGGELGGGKRSLFDFGGFDGVNHGIQLQKMAEDYRDGHIFRLGMDDDGLADNWDSAIITGASFPCGLYTVANWTANQTHRFDVRWGPNGLTMYIDDWQCSSGGNGDTFDPATKTFTLGARVEHFANQHADAVFRNLQLWALGDDQPPPPPPPPPNTTRVRPLQDVTVKRGEAGDPGTAYGFEDSLTVGADGAMLPDEVTLLRFDLGDVEGSVASAVLYLSAFNSGGSQSLYETSTHLRDGSLLWNEFNLTWQNAPLPVEGVVATVPGVSEGQRYAFDVTSIARAGEPLAVMIISSSSNSAGFRSREYAVQGDRPYIDVVEAEAFFSAGFEDGDFSEWDTGFVTR